MVMDISIEHAIVNYFTQWLTTHPYLAWIMSHPLPSGGLLLLIILSLWGLIKAIGRGIEQIWLFLLTTPFKLLQPIFRLMWRSINRIFGHNKFSREQLTPTAMPNAAPERIEQIVDQLHLLSQEQEVLLVELSTLVNLDLVKSKP